MNPTNIDDHIIGSTSAILTIISYMDFLDLHSKLFYEVIKKTLVDDSENIRYIFRHFPQSEKSLHLAKIAEAAGMQGKFWDIVDYFFKQQQTLPSLQLPDILPSVGISIDTLQADLNKPFIDKIIQTQKNIAKEYTTLDIPIIIMNGRQYEGIPTKDYILSYALQLAHASDLHDEDLIDTSKNEAVDFGRDNPEAYEIVNPMEIQSEKGYTTTDDKDGLYADLSSETLDETNPSIGDQDYSDPTPS